jgi:chromosome segregation ATPase
MDNLQRIRERLESQLSNRGASEAIENVRHLPTLTRPMATKDGGAALDLIYHAAEVLRAIEDRASDTERRAKEIAEKAIQKLELAERRIQELEVDHQAARDAIAETQAKLREAEKALSLERSRVKAAEDQIRQIELRATAAETSARETENTLARIEDAIRTQLLQGRSTHSQPAAAA